MKALRTAALALLVVAATAPAASADGLPVIGVDVGRSGVELDGLRYVVLPAPHRTLVAQIATPKGEVVRFRYLRTRFTLPAVAYDGSADGLSADGSTLVLIRPRTRFPRRTTELAILAARQLRLVDVVRLRGDFSFDAVSPDGRTIYLIHYLSPRDATVYEVRAFDAERGRLLDDPIVDPHEPDEQMRGNPITRVGSPDGRWAYTLYDGGGGTPFVHALDTVGRTARCIELDSLAGRRDLGALRLRLTGHVLGVSKREKDELLIDTRTFAVRKPRTEAAPREVARETGFSWVPIGASLAALAVGALGLLGFRRARAVA